MLEAEVLPALAAIFGAIDAIAPGHAALAVTLAGAHPDDIGIMRIEYDSADGVRAFVVKHRLPSDAIVQGLPQAAGSAAGVVMGAIARINRQRNDAARDHCRAD